MVLRIRLGVAMGLCVFLLIAQVCYSQRFLPHDSTYYKNYPYLLTGRFYASKKYTSLFLQGPEGKETLKFYPNTPVTVGVGATYRILSLNVGIGLQFLNPNHEEKGKTRYLDMQSHLYAANWVVDLFGQFYKGYYLGAHGSGMSTPDYYLRPDLRVYMLGTSVYRLTNGKRFSYRAAFLQNEWQKKSAGTFSYGGEVFVGVIKGDSAIIPYALKDEYSQRNIYQTKFISGGPGIGYAYTLVIKKHFFATASLTLTGDIGYVVEYTSQGDEGRTTITPNAAIRSVVGYNSDKWIVTLSWVNTNTNFKGYSSNDQYLIRTGNARFTIAKRFEPGDRFKKRMKIIDALPIHQPE